MFSLNPASTQCASNAVNYKAYLIKASQVANFGTAAVTLANATNPSAALFGPLLPGGVVPALSSSFADTSVAAIVADATDQFEVGVACLDTNANITNNFFTTVTFNGPGNSQPSWQVSTATSSAVGTSTSLSVSPSSPAAHGSTETLTATVTPASGTTMPAGTVDFKDGSTDLGPATVNSSGVATETATLRDGSHSLTATFTPTDATAFSASTSTAVSYTVTPAQTQLGSGTESVTVTISGSTQPGQFTMTVPSTPVSLTVSSDGTSATGSLAPVAVSDARTGSTGWTVSGQASGFTASGGGSFSGNALGWTPSATGTTGAAVTAGGVVAPNGPGLGSTPATLGSSTGDSTATLGASLNLAIPSGQAAGTYTSTITITAI